MSDRPHVPSLLQLCQRVANVHVDAIASLGDDLDYKLVKPILEKNVETLERLEESSPHLRKDTEELWKEFCFREYALPAAKHQSGTAAPPKSWKSHYYYLQEQEAKRIDEVGSRMKHRFLEADQRKKEREIKRTDRIPPAKRVRYSGTQPAKSLLQRTRTEASKIQRSTYTSPILPTMPTLRMSTFSKTRTLIAATSCSKTPLVKSDSSPPPPPSTAPCTGSSVKVTTVLRRSTSSLTTSRSTTNLSTHNNSIKLGHPSPPEESLKFGHPSSTFTSLTELATKPSPVVKQPSHITTPKQSLSLLPSRQPFAPRKDPMASLFLPKHRTYSQLPKA